MRQSAIVTCCLVLLVVFSGVFPGVGVATDGTTNSTVRAQASAPPDPSSDVVGWERGVWYNESIDVDQSDGLSDAELKRYVSRAMARVEYLRNREFKQEVPVSVITRSEYQKQSSNQSQSNASYEAWNNQVWEALFVTGEEKNVQSELGSTLGSSVAGFYSPKDDEIKIVTDSPDQPVIDNATLHHELTHALQDQYYDLSTATYRGASQDGDLAVDGVVEGEANYIEYLYTDRCDSGEWQCVETPKSDSGGSGGSNLNLGIYLTIYQPYSDGPVYVDNLKQQGGWAAVDERFESPPVSTEQTIHDVDEKPVKIDYRDQSSDGWSMFEQGQNGSDTVGEASMFAMFWYQDQTHGNDVKGFNYKKIGSTSGQYDRLNYDAKPTAGWGNDRVFPYKRGSGNDTEYGYVWVTEWDSEKDATQFRETYTSMLNVHDARRNGSVYVVEDGEFADAFRVTQNGSRVVIVNGPDESSLADIRPQMESGTGGGALPGSSWSSLPGFGVPTALGAVALAGLLAVGLTRRRRGNGR